MDPEAPVLAGDSICLSQEAQIASVPNSNKSATPACAVDWHWKYLGCA